MARQVHRVALRMVVRSGAEAAFEDVWLTGARRIAETPGNVGQWLSHDETDGTYYVVSDWVGEEAFAAYERSAGHQEYLAALSPLRVEGDMTLMRIVHHLTGAGGDA